MTPGTLSLTDVLDVVDRVARLHDDAAISPAFAALYLGVSEKTLARYRQTSAGPLYTQYPVDGTRSRNQKVNYIMRDLRSWRESSKVGSTMEAAVVRGMALATTADFQSAQPFFLENGKVARHALLGSKRQLVRLVRQNARIAWLTWRQALGLDWARSSAGLAWARERAFGLLPEAEPVVVRFPPVVESRRPPPPADADWPDADVLI